MLYSKLTDEVMKLAYNAHHGQVDKSGVPYIFHPFHLAEQMDTEEEVVTALLHDVLEDTGITVEQIKAIGIGDEVIDALLLLTHDKSIDYMEYIERLKLNPLARKVKMADLIHNMDPTRIECENDSTRRRQEKYKKAYRILEDCELSR